MGWKRDRNPLSVSDKSYEPPGVVNIELERVQDDVRAQGCRNMILLELLSRGVLLYASETKLLMEFY